MIAIKDDGQLISISVLGEFTLADYKEFEQHVLDHLKAGGVNLLLDLRDMVGYTLDVVWEEIKFNREHRYDFRKLAVVTGDEWMVWLAWLNSLLVDGELRVFDDPGLALAWLDGAPAAEA
ncbi:MAG: STAS/SEC14 domain-containing protein [Pseudomonadota bacterium]